MKVYLENISRGQDYLSLKLDFRKIKTALKDHGVITTKELIYYSSFLHGEENKQNANHNIMTVLGERFFTSDERVALMIKILHNSGVYATEANSLNEFLECQKKNSSFWRKFNQKPYFFREQYTKSCQEDEFVHVIDHNNFPQTNEPITQQNEVISENHHASIPHEDKSSCQEMEEDAQQTKTIPNVPEPNTCVDTDSANAFNQYDDNSVRVSSQAIVDDCSMDAVIASLEQVNVTPMEETDDKTAVVFHQVPDLEDLSDKSNVDEVRVYDIAQKIGVPTSSIQGRIKTHRIGRVKGKRPLKVKFRDEKTRNAFLSQARLKQDVLASVNIVPFVSRGKRNLFPANLFWRKDSRNKKTQK